jgi:hypothetical protein
VSGFPILQQVVAKLPWGHHTVLLDRIKDPATREWYLKAAVEYGWSRSILLHQIETRLHERQGKALTNFSRTLPAADSDLAEQVLKDPYQFYPGRFKNRSSQAPIGVPLQVPPIINAWQRACPDPSPEALMFPTFGRGERKGQAVPRWGKNFLRWRIRPIAKSFGIPGRLVTFQVMRRTLRTDLQKHGSLKDAQGALRHASIKTTGDVYVQTIEESVLNAMNSRTMGILAGWEHPSLIDVGATNVRVKEARLGQNPVDVSQQLDQVGPSSGVVSL